MITRLMMFSLLLVAGSARAETLLTNGDFETDDGSKKIAGWSVEADEGDVVGVRDVGVKVAGDAALRLDTVDGNAKGKALQAVDIKPGERLRLTGQAKVSEGVDFCTIALLTQGSKTPWNELAKVSGRDWSKFGATFEVPTGTERGLLMVYFAGNGSVWVDALALEKVDAARPRSGSMTTVMTDFDEPFLFAYLSFEKTVGHVDSRVTIRAKNGQGGAGTTTAKDWSAFDSFSPALDVKLGPDNRAKQIKMFLTDGDERKSTFTYELSAASRSEFVRLTPADGQPLKSNGLNTTDITGLQIQGAWTGDAIDVEIDKVELVEATTEMLAAREAVARVAAERAERDRQQAMRAKAERERILTSGVDHPADGPAIVHIGMVGKRLFGIELQAGEIVPASQTAYEQQAGDVLKPTGKDRLVWSNGKPALKPAGVDVMRAPKPGERPRKIGVFVEHEGVVWKQSKTGRDLDLRVVDEPGAYRVSIDGGEVFEPDAVYRKSKPNSIAMEDGAFSGQHFIYLELPREVPEGAEVSVEFFGLNTRQASESFVFDSRRVRSEAIHVSYLGFRPDDPLKRAYVSLWAGTGGGRTPKVSRFELLDEKGESVYQGEAVMAVAADQTEPFVLEKNHTQADVYHLDFSEFARSGEYRVHVAGVGVSEPFAISETAWSDAFRVSMHGFLSHRSGIELGPPVTDYVRPRCMVPGEDGFVVYETDVTLWDGESDAIAESLTRQLGPELDVSKLKPVPEAWGGYQDAGDWDRRSQHLICSLRHLELAEITPKARRIELTLPVDEAGNEIADVIDEALWNIDFYRRLQTADGGVRGGVESTAHPRAGETSWQESLLVGAFAADPETTYRYAAAAARAARLLGDHERAEGYVESAMAAWKWAEAKGASVIADAKRRGAKNAKGAEKATAEMRTFAAIELFRLTSNQAFEAAIDPQMVLGNADLAMAYALVSAEMADADLQENAVAAIVRDADMALEFSQQNGFNIALFARLLPLMGYTSIWSTPGSLTPPVLPRAHYLTDEKKYLVGTIASCQYSGGANPMNMSYTTGIGARQPLAPLHLDHRRSGQQPPAGITVYGQSDPSTGYAFDSFAHTWFLNRFGGVNSQQWPMAEAYIDLGNWPAMNEYTVHQTFSNTSFTWGYLAGRK